VQNKSHSTSKNKPIDYEKETHYNIIVIKAFNSQVLPDKSLMVTEW